ncbi:type II secretion system F family protein [Planctomycetota bacterium]
MLEYQYVARTNDGSIVRGRIGGSSPSDAKEKLSNRGRRLVGIEEVASKSSAMGDLLMPVRRLWSFRSVRSSDIELLLQQLAVMLGSGLELTPSLRELSRLSSKKPLQNLCAELADAVEQGTSFAAALTDTGSFRSVVTQLVHVGEQTGELPTTLQRAAEFSESRREAMSNLLSALAYPALVAIAACSVAAYLIGFAIPKLAVFLHAMGRKLPAMTQSLIDVASVAQRFGPQVVVLAIAAMAAFAFIYVWPPGRYRIDKSVLRLPLVGPLLRMAATHQLASSLALMLRSGVFLPEAIETASTLHRNRYLKSQVKRSRERLAKGEDLASALTDRGFETMLPSMIAVGERTGDLPKSLDQVATFYAAQVARKLKRFGRLIEPAIIVVVGGLVGYVYIAFFLALMSAGGNFK